MPKGEFYHGLSLPAAIERLAAHHYHAETRHISEDEHALLLGAAEELRAATMTKAELDDMLGESYSSGKLDVLAVLEHWATLPLPGTKTKVRLWAETVEDKP